VEELKRMGAKININGRCAEVDGVPELHGASVRAVDLRAGCAMVIAGLAAKGITQIDEIYHIFRGYEDLIGKLQAIGADIKVVYPKNMEYSDFE
jgi:UDP-N-acetylglucosamine 1-carboxyvinyltransferase